MEAAHFSRRFEDRALEVLVERLEVRTAHHRIRGRIDVSREREVSLHLVEASGNDLRQRVFLSVDDSLLQGGEDLAEAHRRRARSEGGEHLHALGVLRRPQADASKVLRPRDRPHVVGDHAEAILPEPEKDEVVVVEGLRERLAERPFRDALDLSPVLDQERQIEESEYRLDGVKHRRRHVHLEGPQTKAFEHLLVFAELRRAEDADLDPTREDALRGAP